MEDPVAPTWKGRLIATAVGLIILLIMAEVVLRIAMPHWREYYSGWFMRAISVPGHGIVSTGIPGFDGFFAQNNGDFRVHIKINEFGLRNKEPVEKADDRIWVVGDSMTFGWGVEEEEIYASVIAKNIGQATYNIASPGTDICGYQALLARMPKTTHPRAVVMGLILENDIYAYDCQKKARRQERMPKSETKESFGLKRWLTKNTAAYNFLAVSLKRVNILHELLKAVGIVLPVDTYKNPLSGASMGDAVKRSVNEIETFRKMLPDGTPFLVVIAPGRFELRTGDTLYAELRQAIRKALEASNIIFVDPFDAFFEAGYQPTHFAHDGHWTALGHQLAAREATQLLKRMLNQ